jgi:hypothetical protein
MDILSVMGATASLECAILLIAGVLLLDFRGSRRRSRLVVSLKSTLHAANAQAQQKEPRSQAA